MLVSQLKGQVEGVRTAPPPPSAPLGWRQGQFGSVSSGGRFENFFDCGTLKGSPLPLTHMLLRTVGGVTS